MSGWIERQSVCMIFRKIFNYISHQFKPTKSSQNWETIGSTEQKEESTDKWWPCSPLGTYVRISEGGPSCRWKELCSRRGVWTAGSGLDFSPVPLRPGTVTRPPPVNPAGWSRVGTMGPLRISTRGYFIWHLFKGLQGRVNTPFENLFCTVNCVNNSGSWYETENVHSPWKT